MLDQRVARHVLGMAAAGEAVRREVGLAAELHDALGDLVGVRLLLVRVVEELLRDALRMNAARHEVVTPVAQHAHELGRERVVEQLEHDAAVGGIARRHRALVDVLARALAQRRACRSGMASWTRECSFGMAKADGVAVRAESRRTDARP